MSPTVPLAEYLFTRLRQLGVQSIHGVPGDYNLALLDYVEDLGLHWVGNCNELNAGYAADGYSRIKGLGALITTFGVGELSAANAIAGAFCEKAPVVSIVGTPARHLQESRSLIHHTLNDGDFRRFAQMSAHITVAQANLWDPRTCPTLVDSTLQQCLLHSQPVYIELPADMVSVPVAADRLQSKIEIPGPVASKAWEEAITLVLDRIESSKQPMILVDGEIRAYKILEEVVELIKSTQWPTWTTGFGKGHVDETLPNVHGIWKGSAASKEEIDFIKSCDLILCFGPHFSSTNTFRFSSIPDAQKSILFTSTAVQVRDQTFRDLPAKPFLSTLLKKMTSSKIMKNPGSSQTTFGSPPLPSHDADAFVTQDLFYRRFSDYLQPGDIILAETGTAGRGCLDFKLPSHTQLFNPVTWLSIGYMLPAAQGAALAQRELHAAGEWEPKESQQPRTILFIGDGSFQMTVQELGTIIREKLNVTLILINNDGYTIERCLHGWDRQYNDIAQWRYLQAPTFFGASESKDAEYPVHTFTVKTWGDLERVFGDKCMTAGPGLKMVEVIMGQEDAPITLLTLLQQQKEAQKAQKANGVSENTT